MLLSTAYYFFLFIFFSCASEFSLAFRKAFFGWLVWVSGFGSRGEGCLGLGYFCFFGLVWFALLCFFASCLSSAALEYAK